LGPAAGGSTCAAAAASSVLLYPPSLCLPVATAHCVVSARALLQQQLPPAVPQLSFPSQAPQHSPSTGWPWLKAEGRFFSLPSCSLQRDEASPPLPSMAGKGLCISPPILSKTSSPTAGVGIKVERSTTWRALAHPSRAVETNQGL